MPKTKGTRAGRRIIAALTEAVEAAESGQSLNSRFTIHTVEGPDAPGMYDAAKVRTTRDALGASQAVFAQLLGVSTKLVQGWEQGERTPAPIARRLLDVINKNRAQWIAMLRSPMPAARFKRPEASHARTRKSQGARTGSNRPVTARA